MDYRFLSGNNFDVIKGHFFPQDSQEVRGRGRQLLPVRPFFVCSNRARVVLSPPAPAHFTFFLQPDARSPLVHIPTNHDEHALHAGSVGELLTATVRGRFLIWDVHLNRKQAACQLKSIIMPFAVTEG